MGFFVFWCQTQPPHWCAVLNYKAAALIGLVDEVRVEVVQLGEEIGVRVKNKSSCMLQDRSRHVCLSYNKI
jgi:hypothetical protein